MRKCDIRIYHGVAAGRAVRCHNPVIWVGNLSQLLLAVAALIGALAPIIMKLWDDKKHPTDPRPSSGPRGWAHCGTWAAVVAFALAFLTILYGVMASDPVMGSAAVGRFRLLTAFIGLVAISTGSWGAVTARPKGTTEANETLVLGITGLFGGLITMAAMAVIVLPLPAADLAELAAS